MKSQQERFWDINVRSGEKSNVILHILTGHVISMVVSDIYWNCMCTNFKESSKMLLN